uniref:Uncharacterized protein n=1 Tax=Leersia perrieri TaxID=77586 RepID=A0A0D9VNL7_9ORYZ
MCLATVDDGRAAAVASFGRRGGRRLEIRAFYLRLSSSAAPADVDLTLVYLPAIGGAALEIDGRPLPPATTAELPLRRVEGGDAGAAAYASVDRVRAAEGARFEVYAGKDLAADGVFSLRPGGGGGGGGWRVECRRTAAMAVAEVVVLDEGGAVMRAKARKGIGCGGARLEGIPEEEDGWCGGCECGACGEDDEWEVVVGEDGDTTPEMEAEALTWALEMGAWAVCVSVGLLATARRFRRKRTFW